MNDTTSTIPSQSSVLSTEENVLGRDKEQPDQVSPEVQRMIEEFDNSRLKRWLAWLINAVFSTINFITGARTGPLASYDLPRPQPTHDVTGERILYDRNGSRVPVLYQYDFTWWDQVLLYLTLPWHMWRIWLWAGYDGQAHHVPDISPFKPHGPMLPDIKLLWKEQEEREKQESQDRAKVGAHTEREGDDKSEDAEGHADARMPKA